MGTVTDKQKTFIASLLAERDMPANIHAYFTAHVASPDLTSKRASEVITTLLTYRKAPKPTTAASVPANPWTAANEALADVDTSFYAIPAGYVSAQSIDLYGSDYLFVRVRTYAGRKRVSRVHGAPGAPRYSSLNPALSLAIANVVRDRTVEFAGLWHQHSGRCGKCNALLTDQKSRDLGFGPDCARMLGL